MCWVGKCFSLRDARLYLCALGQRGIPCACDPRTWKGQVEPPAAAHLANLSCVLFLHFEAGLRTYKFRMLTFMGN